MRKVMIVDDEMLARKMLRESIVWEEYGYTVISEAQNIAVPYFLDGQILFCQSDFLSDTDKFFRTQTCFGRGIN